MVAIPFDLIRGNKVLVDTSFCEIHQEGESLHRSLYEGVNGMDNVSIAWLNRDLSWRGEIIGDLRSMNYGIVPQVMKEFGKAREILEEQTKFIETFLGNNPKERKNERKEKLSLLWARFTQLTELRKSFEKNQVNCSKHEGYDNYLDCAERIFLNFKDSEEREALRNHRTRPNTLGLHTDQHILASAYVLSQKMPIVIATRDKNLTNAVDLFYKEMTASNGRGRKPIIAYNPDLMRIVA